MCKELSMKINAISADYSALRAKNVKSTKILNQPQQVDVPQGVTMISFKGGNKAQAIEWCVENKPYFQTGGVATAISDRRTLRVSEADPIVTPEIRKNIMTNPLKSKAFAMPIYNGSLVYKDGLQTGVEVPKIPTGLPETSAFKQFEGEYCLINHPKFREYANVADFLKNEDKINPLTKQSNVKINNNVFILKDVTGSPRKMDFGGTLSNEKAGETDIKLFRVNWYDDKAKKLVPTNDFQIFTDVHASWKKPYEGGGYASTPGVFAQSWKGDGDARSAKAFVELTDRLCEVMSEGGEKFDPATIVCNDSQASYSVEYMAEKAAKGDSFWKGKKATVIGHNMGDGYIGKTSYMNMFVNIADKDLREAVSKDPEYINALIAGEDKVNEYFRKLIPDSMKDAQGGVSAFRNALHYAELGYVPTVSSVSEPYVEKLVRDPSFAPATHDTLAKLYQKGILVGILNSMEDVGMDPYTPGIGGYYKEEYTLPEVAGYKSKKIPVMKTYDKNLVNENHVDINHVREIKRQNKISLFERLNQETLKHLEALKDIPGHEYDMATIIAGKADKKVEVYGYIDDRFLAEAKKPNSDVKLLTAWGRCDTQKGLDTVLESFEKYVHGAGKNDKNTVLVLGGELNGTADEKAIRKVINRMSENPELKGRFAFLNGFAPNKPLASAADFAVFPSRFAPCELTDLESMKVFCSPIVTNCQGLAQKNFDATFEGDVGRVTGYKTKHEYSMDKLEDLRNALPEKSESKNVLDRQNFDKTIKKFRDQISYDNVIKRGKSLTEQEIDNKILTDGGLNYKYNFEILRPFRDQVISDELAGCYERALITDRNKDIQTQMVQNHLKQYTDWERNGELNKSKKSSAQLYRELHFQRDGKEIKEADTLLYKLKEQCKNSGLYERIKNAEPTNGGTVVSAPEGEKGIAKWFKAHKKASIITGSALGVAALGFAGYKAGWFSPKFKNEDKPNHVSCVG